MPQHTLSDQDVKTLRELLTAFKSGRLNTANRPKNNDWEDTLMPEVYAAFTPNTGVPALIGSTPGQANCSIYQIIDGTLQINSSTVLSSVVYNMSAIPVPGNTFIQVNRDKYGSWIVPVNGITGAGGAFFAQYAEDTTPQPTAEGTLFSGTSPTVIWVDALSGLFAQMVGSTLELRTIPANLYPTVFTLPDMNFIRGVVSFDMQGWVGSKILFQSANQFQYGTIIIDPGDGGYNYAHLKNTPAISGYNITPAVTVQSTDGFSFITLSTASSNFVAFTSGEQNLPGISCSKITGGPFGGGAGGLYWGTVQRFDIFNNPYTYYFTTQVAQTSITAINSARFGICSIPLPNAVQPVMFWDAPNFSVAGIPGLGGFATDVNGNQLIFQGGILTDFFQAPMGTSLVTNGGASRIHAAQRLNSIMNNA